MAFIISWRLILSFLVCLLMINGANASSTYNVGDELQWDIPPLGDNIFYKNWAALHRFVVGDILVFNFFDGFHNVAEVSKAAYDACDAQFPISISNSVPTYVTLNSTGEHYYICTIHGHCGAGMKLAINVSTPTAAASAPQPRVAPSAPAPASSSTTTSSHSSSIANPPSSRSTASSPTPSAPPPSSSSTPIVAVAAVPFTLLSIAFIFFFFFF